MLRLIPLLVVLVLVLACPVLGATHRYRTTVGTTDGPKFASLSHNAKRWSVVLERKDLGDLPPHLRPGLPPCESLKGRVPARGTEGCWVTISCEKPPENLDPQGSVICLVVNGQKVLGCGKVPHVFKQCPGEWEHKPAERKKYNTKVTLGATEKNAVLMISDGNKRLLAVGENPNTDLKLAACGDLKHKRDKKDQKPTNCKSPVACETAPGETGSMVCQLLMVQIGEIVVSFCDHEQTQHLPTCDEKYKPIPTEYYYVDLYAEKSIHSEAAFNMIRRAPDGFLDKDISTVKSKDPPECSQLPTGTTNAWPTDFDVKHCLGFISCLDDCDETVWRSCRITHDVSMQGRQTVDQCREGTEIPGVETPCDLKGLGYKEVE